MRKYDVVVYPYRNVKHNEVVTPFYICEDNVFAHDYRYKDGNSDRKKLRLPKLSEGSLHRPLRDVMINLTSKNVS